MAGKNSNEGVLKFGDETAGETSTAPTTRNSSRRDVAKSRQVSLKELAAFLDRDRNTISKWLDAWLWTIPEGDTFEDHLEIEWQTPARGNIHPLQEIMAFAEAVKNGFTSRKRVAASFGESVEDIDSENAEDQKRAELLQLLYPIYQKLMSKDELKAILAEYEAEGHTVQ